jgi:nitrite reductase/ring-hydroxylating ferredoxin subunit
MAINRREFIRRVVAASALVATAYVGFELLGLKLDQLQLPTLLPPSSANNSTATNTAQSSAAPNGYFLAASTSSLNGKASAYFDHPVDGRSLLLNFNGQWKAFNATCTHRPCTVEFTGTDIYCPCHDGYFDPNNGSVTGGPPPSPLPEYGVLVQANMLYVSNKVIN